MEEEKNAVSGTERQNDDANQDYISAINEMKQNMVSREEYEKVRADNKRLLDTVVHGQKQDEVVKEEVDVNALRQELFGKSRRDLSNLDFVDKALQLRKALIEKGEQDPFVMKAGRTSSPEADDFKKAERVASVLQECVDIADGNPDVFNNEFQRRLV